MSALSTMSRVEIMARKARLENRRRELKLGPQTFDVRREHNKLIVEIEECARALSVTPKGEGKDPRDAMAVERIKPGHLLWCQCFVDCAREVLAPEVFSAIRKAASARMRIPDVIPVEMALSQNEKLLLPLFSMLGLRRRRSEVWQEVLHRTDLNEREMDEALKSLCARGMLRADDDIYVRAK